MFYYAVVNFLAGSDATIVVSSEDSLYVAENLFNRRPSKPFQFAGVGAVGDPEFICVEFENPKRVSLAAIFNHNLDLGEPTDELVLAGCDNGCQSSGSGGCDWDNPDYEMSLQDRIVADWNDAYKLIDETRLAYRLSVIDGGNDQAVEIGEFFLGEAVALSSAYLQPGRAESPQLYRHANVTYYGQHWLQSLSESITLELTIASMNDPDVVDAVRKMIMAIHNGGGKFVMVPNDQHPFVYYVALENDGGFMSQIARGFDCELTEWSLSLRTLTKGIALL